MIDTTKTYIADSTDPYRNLAVEEQLLGQVRPGECILYLWRNANTIVFGRNQNAYKECKIEKLLGDGGHPARRLSGGGCVYHDLGNLNFTFLLREEDYDVPRQLSVIVKALEEFGLSAEFTGRNDLCIAGRKFSGNAFYKHRGRCYHHGTILIQADMAKLGEYLHVSAEKLRANSVASVRSRVVNLKELNPAIDVQAIKTALVRAFGDVYGTQPIEIPAQALDETAIAILREKYASSEWIYGMHMRADFSFGARFPWGGIEFSLAIRGDRITGAQVFSDSMDAGLADALARRLEGVQFSKSAMLGAVKDAQSEIDANILGDIQALIERQEIWREE